eukprot:TRINITY_DN15671_c0_g1_i1.p1 TRINITY_DN15671_c0_g1~~TRINITY_DN15671_c0_g1_i1.p1  ORF type:complete len:356 (+),score=102.45 TRINITY_DN15671_c0_g1_i1:102-1070(+)
MEQTSSPSSPRHDDDWFVVTDASTPQREASPTTDETAIAVAMSKTKLADQQEDLRTRCDALEAKLRESDAERETLQIEIAALRSTLGEGRVREQTHLDQLQQQKQELHIQTSAAQAAITALKGMPSPSLLTEELTLTSMKLQDAENREKTALLALDALKQQLRKLEQDAAGTAFLTGELEATRMELSRHQALVGNLEAEVAQLRQSMAQVAANTNVLQSAHSESQLCNQQMAAELDQLRAALPACRAQIERLAELEANKEDELGDARVALSVMQHELMEMRTSLQLTRDQWQSQVRDLQNEAATYKLLYTEEQERNQQQQEE